MDGRGKEAEGAGTAPAGLSIGLLWRPFTKGPLAEEIMEAVGVYEEKLGVRPNCCHVHPSGIPEGFAVDGIRVVADLEVLPRELWIGREGK